MNKAVQRTYGDNIIEFAETNEGYEVKAFNKFSRKTICNVIATDLGEALGLYEAVKEVLVKNTIYWRTAP